MTSQVFYRKWRPQTFSEVVGQQHVTQTLRNAVESGRIAHAYLFCGPRGTGKTSTGRILAKAINCQKPVKGEPCNKCQMCVAFNEGGALDIIEIDAASNRSIEDIRDLRDKINFTPNQSRYKVYIIDEVHMITKDAANAFLKTLEEPPPHAIFVLATTEPHKVLATVLSRCQRFDFHRLSQAAVIDKLKFICDKEGIQCEPEALRLMAKATTGSLRDAENVLEQAVAYYGQTIALHQVMAMLGISGDLRSRELAKHLLNKDVAAGLNTINNAANDGIDLRQFNRELVNFLRDLLLVKSGSEDVVDATSEDLSEMKSLVTSGSLDYLLAAVKCFGEADIRLDNYSPLPLELALVSTVLSAGEEKQVAAPQPAQITKAATENYRPQPQPEPVDTEKPVAEKHVTPPRAGKQAKVVVKPPPIEPEPASVPQPAGKKSAAAESAEAKPDTRAPAPTAVESPEQGDSPEISDVRNRWREFVNALRGAGSKGNLDAMLRSAAKPMSVENNTLTIGFYHDFHKNYIEDPKYKFLVEKKLHEFFGRSYKIRCILTEPSKETRKRPATESPMLQAALQRGAKLIN